MSRSMKKSKSTKTFAILYTIWVYKNHRGNKEQRTCISLLPEKWGRPVCVLYLDKIQYSKIILKNNLNKLGR